MSGIVIILLRFLHREWWRKRYVRWSALFLIVALIFFLAVWAVGVLTQTRTMAYFGAAMAAGLFFIQLGLLLSLPVAAIFNLLGGGLISMISTAHRRKNIMINNRRRFIRKVSTVIPAAVLTSQFTGIAGSFRNITVPIIRLPIANLTDRLHGLKIAHLSDSHLGHYKNLDDLEMVIQEIKDHSPDLVLVTGDISDDLDILLDANRIIAAVNPPYGIFASVGNHEYYRGIVKVRRIFEKSPFPMLIDTGTTINIGGVTVFIGGADDPVHLRGVSLEFLRNTVERTMNDAPSDSFNILMSHRPRGLDFAPDYHVNLVLAGHTHGGQVGISGKSLFENVWPEMYLWGIYRKGNSTLYTSSGMGHWMPFRLGCPTEAPILILEKSEETKPV
jgi:predicted MPP superfamily phosphohydrolase